MSDIFSKQPDAGDFAPKANLVRPGEDINITAKDPAMKKIVVGVGWEVNAFDADIPDLDACCFLLDKNDQTRVDEDFVFYNNPQGSNGAVKHTGDSRTGAGEGDDETILIDIPGVPFDVVKILFVISVYNAHEKNQSLSLIRNGYVRLVNADRNEELLRYDFTTDVQEHKESAMIVGSLDREGPKWHFRPSHEFYSGGLASIARKYGIIIA